MIATSGSEISNDLTAFLRESQDALDYLNRVRPYFRNPQTERAAVLENLRLAKLSLDEVREEALAEELRTFRTNADIARRLNQLYVILLWAICEGRFGAALEQRRQKVTSGGLAEFRGGTAAERELQWLKNCGRHELTLECLRRLRNATAHKTLGRFNVDPECSTLRGLPTEHTTDVVDTRLASGLGQQEWSGCLARTTAKESRPDGSKTSGKSDCSHWTRLVLSIFIQRSILEEDGYLKSMKASFRNKHGRDLGLADVPIGHDPTNPLVNGLDEEWYFNLDKSLILGALREGVHEYAEKFYENKASKLDE